MSEIVREVKIRNRYGLHVRPSSILAKVASRYSETEVFIRKDDKSANGKSMMQLLSLGARVGENIKLVLNGNEADEAADVIAGLVERQFDMDEDEQQCEKKDKANEKNP